MNIIFRKLRDCLNKRASREQIFNVSNIVKRLDDLEWANSSTPMTIVTGADIQVHYRVHGETVWGPDHHFQGLSYENSVKYKKDLITVERKAVAGSIIYLATDSVSEFFELFSNGQHLDIRLTWADERKKYMTLIISNVRMISDGVGFSVDDTSTEHQFSYIADKLVWESFK